jgi:hypothetical protein
VTTESNRKIWVVIVASGCCHMIDIGEGNSHLLHVLSFGTHSLVAMERALSWMFLLSLCGWSANGIPVSETVTASRASPWPMPAKYITYPISQTIDAANFQFRTIGAYSCDLVEAAYVRYYRIIFGGPRSSDRDSDTRQGSNDVLKFWRMKRPNSALSYLDVDLANECEEWPSLNMDESCQHLL